MNAYIEMKKEEFEKAVGHFKKEISALRTGRANPNMLEGVMVDAYGVKTPLNGLSSVSVPDGQSIVISPWDKNILKDIEKAVTDANLGAGVVNEGDKVRLTIPKMTEENRRDLVKKLNALMEESRVTIRQVRDEIKSNIERAEENKEVSEDDKFRFLKELDEEAARRNAALKELRDKKEEDIMTI
jgi:ribosome recycling factor